VHGADDPKLNEEVSSFNLEWSPLLSLSDNDLIMQNIIRILHLYSKCKDCRINYDMYTVETLPQTGISVIRKDINGSPIVQNSQVLEYLMTIKVIVIFK
jgi:hypothetical protein